MQTKKHNISNIISLLIQNLSIYVISSMSFGFKRVNNFSSSVRGYLFFFFNWALNVAYRNLMTCNKHFALINMFPSWSVYWALRIKSSFMNQIIDLLALRFHLLCTPQLGITLHKENSYISHSLKGSFLPNVTYTQYLILNGVNIRVVCEQ